MLDAAQASRAQVQFDGRRFSGPGYERLVDAGRYAGAFLLGEEHGIAENPKLAAQLFADLTRFGYRRVAVETSPPMAEALDRALASHDPAALRALVTDPRSRVAFFGMAEEAAWLRAARASVPGKTALLLGLDYDVAADRFLIDRLAAKPKPRRAALALDRLAAASRASWAKYDQSHDPRFIFSFAGDPTLVTAVEKAWPGADRESRLILDTLRHTLAINAYWVAGKGYDSNLARSSFMRANLLRYWKTRPAGERIFMKMGASHLVRGLSHSEVFDLGTLVPDLLAERGETSFNLLVLPGEASETANLDPTSFRYVPAKQGGYGDGLDIFYRAALPGGFTLFETAPLRPLASGKSLDPRLTRAIYGFDAVLVMTGSTPSSNF